MTQCRACGRHVKDEAACAFCGAELPKLPPDPEPILPPADPPKPIPYDGPVPLPAYGGPPGRRLVPSLDARPSLETRGAARLVLLGLLAIVLVAGAVWLLRLR